MTSNRITRSAVTGTLAACLLALGAQGALAQVSQEQAAALPAPRPDKALYMKIFEYRLLGAGKEDDCPDTSSECEVNIDISQVSTPSGELYCLAQLSEIIRVGGTSNGGPEKNKKIVWSLKLDLKIDTTKYTFKFQDEFGILVLLNSSPKQIHDKGIGAGSGTHANDSMYFHAQNRRNKKSQNDDDPVATYLPVILQTEWKGSVGVESLCGAADPRIIND